MHYILLTILFLLTWLLYRPHIIGRSHIPSKGRLIIAANHSSYIDPLFIGSVLFPWRRSYFLTASYAFRIPLLSWLIKKVGAISISREASASKALLEAKKNLLEEKIVTIFPEGTRSDGKLLPFKAGIGWLALETKAPILPIYLVGIDTVWPRSRTFPKVYSRSIYSIVGSPMTFSEDLSAEKITLAIRKRIEELRSWHELGQIGEPP